MNDHDPIVIVSGMRTPIGHFQGSLKDVTATELGSTAIAGVIKKSNIIPHMVQSVIMGCVLPAYLGQAPARQAAIGGGLNNHTGCTTINKMCGSGMKAAMLAHDILKYETREIMIVGGMESMTNAPYLLPYARYGYRLGHYRVIDHMFYDGLEDAYEKGALMGTFAEKCALKYKFSREQQDEYATISLERAKQATESGIFAEEIAPVLVKTKQGEQLVDKDDGPFKVDPNKIPLLRPAFSNHGTVTAANSSSISDGAAALLMMRQSSAQQLGLQPLVKIIGHTTHSQEPDWFTTAPIYAIRKLLDKINWTKDNVDLFEINEAFAVVVLAAIKELGLPLEKVNVHGGATVLGHPIGASGARILVTLINAMRYHQKPRGVAAICIGGGESTAMALELC
jgi:acetyl-CoA C-acetyltransferase